VSSFLTAHQHIKGQEGLGSGIGLGLGLGTIGRQSEPDRRSEAINFGAC